MLAINLCTRGRPDLLLRTVTQTLECMAHPQTILWVSLDDDDHASIAAMRRVSNERLRLSIEPREDSLGGKYNRILSLAPAADAYLAMVDYAPHVTPQFDVTILEAASSFPDGIGVVYNWMANLSFPQINAVTRGLTDIMGYLYPPYFPYWFVDHWLDDIARMIERIAFADVHIDTSLRPGTQEMREPAFWATFFDLCVLERRAIATRIIAALDEPHWRRDLLRRNFPLIEHRSVCINQIVRNDLARAGIVGHMPERYLRLREAARARAPGLVASVQEAGRHETMPILAAA